MVCHIGIILSVNSYVLVMSHNIPSYGMQSYKSRSMNNSICQLLCTRPERYNIPSHGMLCYKSLSRNNTICHNSYVLVMKVIISHPMVCHVTKHYCILAHCEQGVNVWLTVLVMTPVEVHHEGSTREYNLDKLSFVTEGPSLLLCSWLESTFPVKKSHG